MDAAYQASGLTRLAAALQVERGRVDAEALPRRLVRTIWELVPQVRTARGTADLDAAHPQGGVLARPHVRPLDRSVETRPAGARVELMSAIEQGRLTDDAAIHALVVTVPVRARERGLGSRALGHIVLLGREVGGVVGHA